MEISHLSHAAAETTKKQMLGSQHCARHRKLVVVVVEIQQEQGAAVIRNLCRRHCKVRGVTSHARDANRVDPALGHVVVHGAFQEPTYLWTKDEILAHLLHN